MRPFKVIGFALLMWPVAEIAAFIIVAEMVGTAAALALMILVSVCGVLVLRRLGGGAVTRLRATAGSTQAIGMSLNGAGAATALGGILLAVPGFITGFLGLAMVVPASRRWVLATAKRIFAGRPRASGSEIVDLAPEEWRQVPDRELPSREHQPEP
jgi:UPF0716 protein FxsA